MKNKYFSFAFFTTFGIKAAEDQTGEINITVDGKNVKINNLEVSKIDSEHTILHHTRGYIKEELPLYNRYDYFISELKIGDTVVDNIDRENIIIPKGKTAHIVLKKKLKVKEIKFTDPNFNRDLTEEFKDERINRIECYQDLTYKSLFNKIRGISGLFKTGVFGIKLNNFEDTNEKPYNGEDVLNEGDEITVILDNDKIEEKAFSKFVIEGDKDIIDIYYIKGKLEDNLKNNSRGKIKQIFTDEIFSNEFDVYKNDDNNPIKSNSEDSIPVDLRYFRVKLIKNNLNLKDNNNFLKCNCKLKLGKKGCKLVDENVLKLLNNLSENFSFSTIEDLIFGLKELHFINKNIDKNMISVKNQDESDTKEYNKSTAIIPARIIVDLSPEALILNQVKVVFSIADVKKDGRKLKGEFKNKITEDGFHLAYGDNKSVLINLITNIIPDITEGDIKLNGQALPEQIKEGGEISIPVEKIPVDNFEPESKPEEKDKFKKGEGTGGDNGTNNGDKVYCGSTKKN